MTYRIAIPSAGFSRLFYLTSAGGWTPRSAEAVEVVDKDTAEAVALQFEGAYAEDCKHPRRGDIVYEVPPKLGMTPPTCTCGHSRAQHSHTNNHICLADGCRCMIFVHDLGVVADSSLNTDNEVPMSTAGRPMAEGGFSDHPQLVDADDIHRWFTYHPPTPEQPEKFRAIRDEAHDLAFTIMGLCPRSVERDLAFDKLREVVMWANAAIACEPVPPPPIIVIEDELASNDVAVLKERWLGLIDSPEAAGTEIGSEMHAWSGAIAFESTVTVDNRRFQHGALVLDGEPLPLTALPGYVLGAEEAQVGTIDTMQRFGNVITATGYVDMRAINRLLGIEGGYDELTPLIIPIGIDVIRPEVAPLRPADDILTMTSARVAGAHLLLAGQGAAFPEAHIVVQPEVMFEEIPQYAQHLKFGYEFLWDGEWFPVLKGTTLDGKLVKFPVVTDGVIQTSIAVPYHTLLTTREVR